MQKLFFILSICFIAQLADAQTTKDSIVLFDNSVIVGQIVNFQFDSLYVVSGKAVEKYHIGAIRKVIINPSNPSKDAIESAVLRSGYKSNNSVMVSNQTRTASNYTAGHYLKQSSNMFIGAAVVGFLGGIISTIMLSGDGAGAAPYALGITGAGALGLGIGGIVNLSKAGAALERGNVGQYQYTK